MDNLLNNSTTASESEDHSLLMNIVDLSCWQISSLKISSKKRTIIFTADQAFISSALLKYPKFKHTYRPVTVAERSEACTLFARSEAGIVGSNSTQGMDV
jgi:hypothetical protein